MRKKVSANGVVFTLVLVAVGFFGPTLLITPLLLLLPISLSLYRRWADHILYLWFHLPPALIELVFRVKLRICGDLKRVEGPCIFILNHRTRFDWMFFWSYIIRMGNPHKHRIVLKESLKNVPGFGWGMQACNFIFLARKWTEDEKVLSDHLTYFTSRGYPLQLLFFPEGTDLSESNREKSRQFSDKNGLPRFDYVLHPRTKGFTHCLRELRKGPSPPSIVNVSVAYVGHIPQNESDILAGHWPMEIHFCAETVPPSDVPLENGAVDEWLKERWQEKEEVLKRFYSEKKFSAPYLEESSCQLVYWKMIGALVFWASLLSAALYCLFCCSLLWWLLLIIAFYLAVSHLGPGLDRVIIYLHQMTYQAKLFK